MFRVNVYEIYRIGIRIHPLNAIEAKMSIGDHIPMIFDAMSAVEDLLNSKSLSLRATRATAEQLNNILSRVIFDEYSNDSSVFSLVTQSELRKSVQALETILAAELATQDIYSVTQKSIYNTSDLIEKGESILAENLRPHLPPLALYDLQQAGRCLAFEIPTSAGFHMLRAVEAVTKKYYEVLSGSPWANNKRDLGEYLKALSSLNAPTKIIDSIHQMKNNYRNPLMHPDENLNLPEALGLFGAVQSLLSLILQEIGREVK